MKFNYKKFGFVCCLLLTAILCRLLSPVPNFNPTTAIVLFSSFLFPFYISITIPLFIMILSDVFFFGFDPTISPFVYLSLVLVNQYINYYPNLIVRL